MGDTGFAHAGEARRTGGSGLRLGPVLAEAILLLGLLAFDEVMSGRFGLHRSGGALSTVFVLVIVALAALRRVFPNRLALVAGCAIALSLAHSTLAMLAHYNVSDVAVGFSVTEFAAVALLLGAVARRAGPWAAAGLVCLGGVAINVAPFARTGTGVDVKMFAVPGALLWGVAVTFGLVLRDADARRTAAFAGVRRAERMRLARELHDLVTHHVTGIAVRAQAAQIATAKSPSADIHQQTYEEIQQAAAASLTAMRRLVGMLRADEAPAPVVTGIRAALSDAVATDARVTVDLAEEVCALDPDPDVAATLHWVVLESLTNVRRHAREATKIRVTVFLEPRPAPACLVLDVVNDGVTALITEDAAPKYGVIGMRERLTALGGTLQAGPEPGQRWRVSARVPLVRRRASPADSNEGY
jgi:signal transduction histidine kinase